MSTWMLETGNCKLETRGRTASDSDPVVPTSVLWAFGPPMQMKVPPTRHSEHSEESASSVLHRQKQISHRFAPRNDRVGFDFRVGATTSKLLLPAGPNPEARIPAL
jgi:hypothetical protein